MAHVRVQTELLADAKKSWRLVKEPATLRFVARGLIGFRGELPREWEAGQDVTVRLMALHVLPLNDHRVRIVGLDETRRTLTTSELGGRITRWDHRITVEPSGPGRSRYTDEIDIEAGPLTPLVAAYARFFYRYRQRRLRKLARRRNG